MTSILKHQGIKHESPFDSICHFDEQGKEFWSGRELQPILGYVKWQKFKSVIENALENLETVTGSTSDHFLPVEVKSNGRPAVDYKLSRLACYHVALCCDSRGNDAVKMAKHYFAVKTREAETVIPAQNERIRELELLAKIAELEKATSENHLYLEGRREFILNAHGPQMLALIQGRPDAVVEKIEKVTETIVCRDGRNVSFEGKSTAELGRELGFKSGKEFERWIEKRGRQDLICQGFRALQAPYIPTEKLSEVKRLWAENRKSGDRQLFLGE